MLAADGARRSSPKGATRPRLAPPEPITTPVLQEYLAAAAKLRIELVPWQRVAARYMIATQGKRWRWPEVCIVVARQNGKTKLLLPRVLMGLERGESILHTAQNRKLPGKTFREIASAVLTDPVLGATAEVRKANGQEEVRLPGGGRYFLVAPTPGAARGETADLVLIDEVREQQDQDLMDAILPTITARPGAQVIYLSNAGDEDSVILNELKRRGEQGDGRLAYLEWSAGPERGLDDVAGWAEANPMLGYGMNLATLEGFRRSRPPTSFETEHLCRWVQSMLPGFLPPELWERQHAGRGTTPHLEHPARPTMAVALDASGRRASVCLAWMQTDGSIALRLTDDLNAEGGLDIDRMGRDLRDAATRAKVRAVGHDPETEAELIKYQRQSTPVIGRAFTAASQTFVQAVQAGRLRWEDDTGALTADLAWTARRIDADDGTFFAVKAKPDRPITAILAAIRAVSLATGDRPPSPRVF